MKTLLILGVIGITAFIGCGGGSGGSCGKVAPCGGNIVGEWTIADVCFSASAGSTDCPTATTDTSGIKMTGTVSYKADMTYAVSVMQSGTMRVIMPASCLTQAGVTVTCAQLTAAIQAGMATDPDPAFQSVNCAASGGGCACTFVMTPQTIAEMGTYATSGNVLTEVSAASPSTPSQNDYCVQGNELQIIQPDSMPMPMGMTMSSAVVLRK